MVDILSESSLEIFEIDAKEKIITKIKEKQNELLKLFNKNREFLQILIMRGRFVV